MKRLLLILLFIPTIAFAAFDWNGASVSSINGATASGWNGVALSSGGSGCPTGTYTFSWSGEYSSGVTYGCDSIGTSVSGSIEGSPDISTTYGEGSPDVAIRYTATSQQLTFSNTSSLVNLQSAQTVWVRAYLSVAPSGSTLFFEFNLSTYTGAYCEVHSNFEMYCYYNGATPNSAYGNMPSGGAGAWFDFAYSYDPENTNHSVNTNSTWQDDNGEIATIESNATDIIIGSAGKFSSSGDARVTRLAVVPGYKAAKPW